MVKLEQAEVCWKAEHCSLSTCMALEMCMAVSNMAPPPPHFSHLLNAALVYEGWQTVLVPGLWSFCFMAVPQIICLLHKNKEVWRNKSCHSLWFLCLFVLCVKSQVHNVVSLGPHHVENEIPSTWLSSGVLPVVELTDSDMMASCLSSFFSTY